MQSAKNHQRENERLAELQSFHILDTLPEEDYDSLTALASEICGVPIALISLIDNKRQWFKSKQGLDASETPKELAFCAHAINDKDDIFIIEDSRKDIRFFDNPLVTEQPHVIFYAGVPLYTENNLPLGTLCIIDNEPKKLTQKQKDSLRNLAKQVMNLLKLRKQNFQLSESLLKIEAKNKELEQFAYITAHDLQEPLRTITSFIQLFKEEFRSEMDETQKTYFDFISKASNRMSEQIRSLLEYSRLGSRGKKDWIDTSKLVEELKNDLTDICSRNNGEIISSTLPKIYGYTVEFRLLLQNLICNGIKFRKKEQNPIIQITCMETDNEWIFCVEDNGIGIENRHFEKIFAIFQRLNNHEDYEGTGIGLAHCKKIVSLHKGEIWVESIINEGSKFFFSISKQL